MPIGERFLRPRMQKLIELMGSCEQQMNDLVTQRNAAIDAVKKGHLRDDTGMLLKTFLCDVFPMEIVRLEELQANRGGELHAIEASLDSGKAFKNWIWLTDPKWSKALEEQKKKSEELYDGAYAEYQKAQEEADKKARAAQTAWEAEVSALAKRDAARKKAAAKAAAKEEQIASIQRERLKSKLKAAAKAAAKAEAAAGESFVMVNMPSGGGVSVNSEDGDWALGVEPWTI